MKNLFVVAMMMLSCSTVFSMEGWRFVETTSEEEQAEQAEQLFEDDSDFDIMACMKNSIEVFFKEHNLSLCHVLCTYPSELHIKNFFSKPLTYSFTDNKQIGEFSFKAIDLINESSKLQVENQYDYIFVCDTNYAKKLDLKKTYCALKPGGMIVLNLENKKNHKDIMHLYHRLNSSGFSTGTVRRAVDTYYVDTYDGEDLIAGHLMVITAQKATKTICEIVKEIELEAMNDGDNSYDSEES